MSIPVPYTSAKQTDDFGLTVSNLIFGAALAASTNTALTIPGSSDRFKAVIEVVIPAATSLTMSLKEVASIPSGAAFAAGTSELVSDGGMCREVKGGDVLNFFANGADVIVTVTLYSV